MSQWNNFDEIVCICLESRNDRFIEQKKIFDNAGIPVSFYRPKKHKNGGVQGCFESHINVITDCYNRGLNNVLIFEDDATPTSYFTPDSMNECCSFMNTNSDWDLLFLGSNVKSGNGIENTSFPHIYKSRFLNAHAYVVSRKGMEKYANLKFISQIDVIYAANHHSYAFLPSIFNQRLSQSDIADNEDYMGLKNQSTHKAFQSINNYYAAYIGYKGKCILEIFIFSFVWLLYKYPQHRKLFFSLFIITLILYKFVNWIGYLQYNH